MQGALPGADSLRTFEGLPQIHIAEQPGDHTMEYVGTERANCFFPRVVRMYLSNEMVLCELWRWLDPVLSGRMGGLYTDIR